MVWGWRPFEAKAEETAQHCHMLYLFPCLIRGQLSGQTGVDLSKGSHIRPDVNVRDPNKVTSHHFACLCTSIVQEKKRVLAELEQLKLLSN